MDLDLLVIGVSYAGWERAVAAARLHRRVGLIAIPSPAALPQWDLRQCPDHVLQAACAQWALAATPRQTALRHSDPLQWREFATRATTLWQRELDSLRQQLLAAKGRIWTGTPLLTGAHSVVVTGSGSPPFPLRSEQLLIATGTRPQRPWFAVSEPAGLHEAARLLDASDLPGEACVVGAGVTGLRAACLLAWWGTHVRVIDGRQSSFPVANDDTCDLLNWAERLEVDFEFGEDVIGVRSHTGRQPVGLTLESGRQVRTESVWLATGRRGRTDELKLEHARLMTDETGRLWCGPQLRTWIPSISAAGDVVGYASEAVRESEPVGPGAGSDVEHTVPVGREATAGRSLLSVG